jgi:hypothetical protein
MKHIIKVRCDKCHSKIATWEYQPSDDYTYYCEDCVPRGCSCNIDPETDEPYKDDQGRLLPCCEFYDQPNGWTANYLIRDINNKVKWINCDYNSKARGLGRNRYRLFLDRSIKTKKVIL